MGYPIGDDDQYLLHVLLDAAAVLLPEQDAGVSESLGSVCIPSSIPATSQILSDFWAGGVCVKVEKNLRIVWVFQSSKLNSVPANVCFLHQVDSQVDHALLLPPINAARVIQHKYNV